MRDRIELRIDPTEREAWEQAAKDSNLTLSEFVRTSVNQVVRTNKPVVRTKKENVRTNIENVRTEAKELVRTVEPEKVEKPQKTRGKSIAQEMAEDAIREVRQRGKPNQVCRSLGHRFMMQDGRMTCERCGVQA